MDDAIIRFYEFQAQHARRPSVVDDLLTVVIMNWRREDFLTPCVESVVRQGIQNIVLVTFEASEQSLQVHRELLVKYPFIRGIVTSWDLGVNELWLQAAYQAETPYILMLPDDDELTEAFGPCYWGLIRPELARSVGWVWWDGLVKDNGRVTDEYHTLMPTKGSLRAETGLNNPAEFLAFYRDPNQSVYPISPAVQIQRTDICRQTYKECAERFRDRVYFSRPKMLLGNEILATLRALQRSVARGEQVFYVHEALTYYGRHGGSESEIHVRNGSSALVNGYVAARHYFNANPLPPKDPPSRIIHVVNTYSPRDADTQRRNRLAMRTWLPHYETAQVVFRPVPDGWLPRDSGVLGDARKVAFLRDLFEHGVRMAAPEDIVMLTNADICLSTDAIDKVFEAVRKNGCCFTFRRDFYRPLDQPVPDAQIGEAQWYVGSDLFAFNVEWWQQYGRAMYPDFLIGKPCWDWIMRCLMGYSFHGLRVFESKLEDQGREVECPAIIYHEKHDSWAERPEVYHRDRANRYNFLLAYEWLRRYAGTAHIDGFFQFPQDLVNRSSLYMERFRSMGGEDMKRFQQLGGHRFQWIRRGYNQWPVELALDGNIREGTTHDAARWMVWQGKVVFASGSGEPTYELEPSSGGLWRGRSERSPNVSVELIPLTASADGTT